MYQNHLEEVLAPELSTFTGETVVEAAVTALRERLVREQAKRVRPPGLKEDLLRIGRECARLPILDARAPDDILGYDDHGVPA